MLKNTYNQIIYTLNQQGNEDNKIIHGMKKYHENGTYKKRRSISHIKILE